MGRAIKRRRESKGWTQAQLATKARISQGYVAKLESGARQSLSLPVLKRLAKVLDLPVTALLK